MSASDLQKLFQEVVILGTGRGASSAEVAWLEGFYQDGDWTPLVHLVNSYMDTVTAQKGLVPTIKAVALQALGVQLSDTEAEAVGQLLTSGQKTWADLFAWCIERTDVLGQTLSNRAEAAQAFVTDLAAAGKSALFAGAAVENAVKTLLQGITASSTSLGNGKAGLGALVAALTEQGIKSTVVDGYIKGATVFVDANGNGVLDEGEFSTTTDASGNYVLPSDATAGKVIAFGGTDILTGKAFSGVLTAPAGSTVVNPITTLVDALVSSGKPVAEAKAAVQTALNLPSDINLLAYDPLAILADTNASTEAKNAALEVQKAALQVSTVIAQAAAAIDAASTAATLQTAASSVINALAQTVVQAAGTGSAVNLAESATVAAIVQTAGTAAGAPSVASLATDLAAITAALNATAANAGNITQLAQTAAVAQESAIAAITSGVASGSLAAALNNFTGSALASQVNQATVTGEIAPGVPASDAGGTGGTGGESGAGGGGAGPTDTTPPLLLNEWDMDTLAGIQVLSNEPGVAGLYQVSALHTPGGTLIGSTVSLSPDGNGNYTGLIPVTAQPSVTIANVYVTDTAGNRSAFIPHQVLLGTSGNDGFLSSPQQMAIYYPLGGSDTISFGDPAGNAYGVERIVGLEWGANGDRLDFTLYLGGVQLADADTNAAGIQAFTAATSGVSSPADISGKVALVQGDIPEFFLNLFDSGATFSLQPGAKAVVIQEAPSTDPSEHRAIIQFVSKSADGTGMHATQVADILFASGSSIQSAVADNLTPPFDVVGSDSMGHIVGYGLVTVTENGTNYVFTSESGSSVTVPKTQYTGYILHGVTLVGAMDVLNGMVVAGYGNVQATGTATGVASLAGIGTDITFASNTLHIADGGSVIVQSGPVSGDTLQITGTSGGMTETLQLIGTPDGDSIDVSKFTTTDALVIVSGNNGNDTITLSSTAEEVVGFSAASQGTDTVIGFNPANDTLSFARPNFGGAGISLAGAGTGSVSVTGSSSSKADLSNLGDNFSGVIRVGNTAASDFANVAAVINGAITGNNPGINAIVLVGNGTDTRVYFWNDADTGSQSQVDDGELTLLATLVGVGNPTAVEAFSAG